MAGARIAICDVTLREGEQAVDVAFTLEEKVAVAQLLEQARVDLIQVGHPWGERETIAAIRDAGVAVPLETVIALSRADWSRDLTAAIASGANSVQLVTRIGAAQLAASDLGPEDIMARAREAISTAREGGLAVALGLAYALDAADGVLANMAEMADRTGAARIVIADSLGRARPGEIGPLVASVVGRTAVPVGIHCHNDFGLALAHSLEAVAAGATWIDASVLGIGERAGNVGLEEVAVALSVLMGLECGIDLPRLRPLARSVAEMLVMSIPPHRPVVGSGVFASKLDLHVAGLKRAAAAFMPYPPERVGAEFEVRVGAGSGKETLAAKLEQLAVTVPDDAVTALLRDVRKEAQRNKRAVPDERLLELARAYRAAAESGGSP